MADAEGPLLAVTEALYDAAAGGTPWAAVEAGLRDLVGAGAGVLMVADHAGGPPDLLWREAYSDADVAAYFGRYRHLDLWTTRAAAALARGGGGGPDAPVEVLLGGERFVPDAEYVRSEFYHEFGRPRGLRHVVGAVVPLGEAGLMPIAFHRPDGAAPFGERERGLVRRAVPHLRRAVQLRHRLRAADAAAGLAALDAMPTGALVLDGAMRVWVANAAAEALAARPGAALRLRAAAGLRAVAAGGGAAGGLGGGTVVAAACHPADDARLAALVRGVAAGAGGAAAGGALRLRDAEGAADVAALVSPLPARLARGGGGGGGRSAGRALVLLRDLAARALPPPRPALLRDLFGLTAAEAAVACALAGGATKGEVAAARGIGEVTVKTQARAVLEKTGTASLRELEALLAGLRGV